MVCLKADEMAQWVKALTSKATMIPRTHIMAQRAPTPINKYFLCVLNVYVHVYMYTCVWMHVHMCACAWKAEVIFKSLCSHFLKKYSFFYLCVYACV